jgi:hypothetical protein
VNDTLQVPFLYSQFNIFNRVELRIKVLSHSVTYFLLIMIYITLNKLDTICRGNTEEKYLDVKYVLTLNKLKLLNLLPKLEHNMSACYKNVMNVQIS